MLNLRGTATTAYENARAREVTGGSNSASGHERTWRGQVAQVQFYLPKQTCRRVPPGPVRAPNTTCTTAASRVHWRITWRSRDGESGSGSCGERSNAKRLPFQTQRMAAPMDCSAAQDNAELREMREFCCEPKRLSRVDAGNTHPHRSVPDPARELQSRDECGDGGRPCGRSVCWKTGSAGDLSLRMFLVLAAGVALWILYGVLQSDLVIIVSNSASLAMLSGILYFKVRQIGPSELPGRREFFYRRRP